MIANISRARSSETNEIGASSSPLLHSNDARLAEPSCAASALDVGALLVRVQEVLLTQRQSGCQANEVMIEQNAQFIQRAIDEVNRARERQREADRGGGGFFDGIEKTLEAATVDLVSGDSGLNPFEAAKRSLDKIKTSTLDSKQFWKDVESGGTEIAKWGAVAASVALSVVSCGGAAPIAALAVIGAVASSAGAVESSFHLLEKCGVDSSTASWIAIGMSVGGAVFGGGAGVLHVASTGRAAAIGAQRALAIGADAVEAGSAGAQVAAGAARANLAQFDHRSALAQVDVRTAEHRENALHQVVDELLGSLSNVQRRAARSIGAIQSAAEIHHECQITLFRA